jgi:hypothetical protein
MLPLALYAAGVVLLRWHFLPADRAPWVALVAGAATLLVVVGVRSAWTDAYRIQVAVRAHVDPGPRLREKADRYAQWGSSRIYWLLPLNSLSQLIRARWEAPAQAVAGTLLLTVAVVTIVVRWRRLAVVADRWLEDPPGPPREPHQRSARSAELSLTIVLVGGGVLLVVLFIAAVLIG